MYKSGKNWVFAGVIGLTMGTGAILTTITEASADEKKHASTLTTEDDEDAPRNSNEVRLDASETKASSVSEETKLISDAQNSEEAVVAETSTEATTEVESSEANGKSVEKNEQVSEDTTPENQQIDSEQEAKNTETQTETKSKDVEVQAEAEVGKSDGESEVADTTDVKSDDNKTETQATDAITQPEAKINQAKKTAQAEVKEAATTTPEPPFKPTGAYESGGLFKRAQEGMTKEPQDIGFDMADSTKKTITLSGEADYTTWEVFGKRHYRWRRYNKETGVWEVVPNSDTNTLKITPNDLGTYYYQFEMYWKTTLGFENSQIYSRVVTVEVYDSSLLSEEERAANIQKKQDIIDNIRNMQG